DQRVDPTGPEPRQRSGLELLRPRDLDGPDVLPRLRGDGLAGVCSSTGERKPGDGKKGKATACTAASGCGSHLRLLFGCGVAALIGCRARTNRHSFEGTCPGG